jgi:DNA-binding CsgD family transcriptional regulator
VSVVDPGFEPVSWRDLVAIGVIAGEISAATIARYGGVGLASARQALAEAERAGVLVDGVADPDEAVRMVAELPASVVAEVHAAVARYLLSEGPSRLVDALGHARAAGSGLFPVDELADLADHGAATSLSVGDYRSARALLELADEVGRGDPRLVRARRLCDLAVALDGLGEVTAARSRLADAFEIAELAGDADLAALAAVRYSLPVDWYAGDRRAGALLQRAESLPLRGDQQVMVDAARAMVEMRIPLPTGHDYQLAWVTRPSVAQPLADDALAASDDAGPMARLLALLAWRTTHRAPVHLTRRRRLSAEALDIAQRLREPGRQVDAAVMVAVDALESGDRPGFDQALSVLRWIAEVDGNPRLGWHALTVAAGAAHLDGDLDAAARYRDAARDLGQAINTPGWFGAELLLLGQELLTRADPDEIRPFLPDDQPVEYLSPLGKLLFAQGHALLGDTDTAERLLRRALRQFDHEASILLCATRAAELATRLRLGDVVDELWALLEPWSQHVAVDSQAWWCDGPVSFYLALLALHRGDTVAARRLLAEAEPVARRLGDVRTLGRITSVRGDLGAVEPASAERDGELTDRELTVLGHVVDGATNPQIAAALAYSPSTIRNDLSAIYRKLGVTTRAEAAARAIALGLARSVAEADGR